MANITFETDPALYEKLKTAWEEEGKRGYVIGPTGINYRAIPAANDTVIFVPQTGVDGSYSGTSTGGIVK